MKMLLLMCVILLGVSCTKNEIENGIKGKWHYTGATVAYTDGPYKNFPDDMIIENTKETMYRGDISEPYVALGGDSVSFTNGSLIGHIKFQEKKRDGFILKVYFPTSTSILYVDHRYQKI